MGREMSGLLFQKPNKRIKAQNLANRENMFFQLVKDSKELSREIFNPLVCLK